MNKIKLGINIDHVATLRNARGGLDPDPLRAAKLCESLGVDNITLHLREDRRHIKDDDLKNIIENITIPINLEIASTDEMIEIAAKSLPYSCCIVPEKRNEITTEGGLDLNKNFHNLKENIHYLKSFGIKTSLFIDPNINDLDIVEKIYPDAIEIHVGKYCDAIHEKIKTFELKRIVETANKAKKIGLEVHAGHGLNFLNVRDISSIKNITELNIGHFIIGESIFVGIKEVIKKMKYEIENARIKS